MYSAAGAAQMIPFTIGLIPSHPVHCQRIEFERGRFDVGRHSGSWRSEQKGAPGWSGIL